MMMEFESCRQSKESNKLVDMIEDIIKTELLILDAFALKIAPMRVSD